MYYKLPQSIFIGIVAVTTISAACGGRSAVDHLVMSGSGGAMPGGNSSTSQGGSGGVLSATSSNSGPQVASSSVGVTSSSGAGGAPPTTNGAGGQGPSQGAGGQGPSQGAGGQGSAGINCGTEVCGDAGSTGEICCFDDNDPADSFCAPSGDCGNPSDFIELQCMNPSDCPGAICCGIFDPQGMNQGYQKVYCDPDCDPNQAGDDIGLIMCGDDPSVCPGGPGDCTASNVLPTGHKFCESN